MKLKVFKEGDIVGNFMVLSRQGTTDLYNCRCTSPQGHPITRPAHLLRSAHASKCPQCRREEKLITVLGKVFGRLKVIGQAENSKTGHAIMVVACVDCGYERQAELRELRRQKRNDGKLFPGITGRACPRCKELKLEMAKQNPPQWSSETSNEIIAAIRRGVCACVIGDERERIEDESVSASLLELMQFPNIHEMNHKQLLGTAFRLGRRVALSTIQAQRQDDHRQIKPVTEDFAEDGATVDLFEKIITPDTSTSEVDELQAAALDLTEDERAFMCSYLETRGVKSKSAKARYTALVSRCRENYAQLLDANLAESQVISG